ncbi:hypothetical protein CK203_042455 [Vitis vinifera]|uniref:Retrovirus-related Pol polyprotein from transposon TNT 1-94-like beta-barrel domain-containing protein n=1 Tax=Vitis vinifera TaxID=29760 RepID=A0A438HEX7_VITVI|nr:hypothetical protein CK203_042455 [Vitis vinifera]
MCYPTTQELWENVNKMYSDLGNQSQIFELTLKLGEIRKTCDKPGRAIIPIANEVETSPFTTEQMEHLLALLKSNLTSGTSSVYLAHTGNELYALSCCFKSTPWIIDSGASDHMTNSSNMFESYSLCPGNKKVRIADGNFSPIAGKANYLEILIVVLSSMNPIVFFKTRVRGRRLAVLG